MTNLLEKDIEGHIGTQPYYCQIKWHNGQIIADEPPQLGGQDLGPDPYSLLLASLAACTLSTLRMYIDRKGWHVPEITVRLNMSQSPEPPLRTHIRRDIAFGAIEDSQKARLLVIAEKCPVSKLLKGQIEISAEAV